MLVNVRTAAIVLASACVSLAQTQQPKSANTNAASEGVTKALDNTLITSMTLEAFEKILQGMGFECRRGKDANGQDETYITFRAEGYKLAAFVPESSFIELYNSFTDVNPTPAIVNEWNEVNRFSRAYADKEGNATIEDDLILSGGVTRENVDDFRQNIQRYSVTVGALCHRPQTQRCQKVG